MTCCDEARVPSCGQVSDKDVRVGKDGVAVKHSPQEADEWQAEVGTLAAEFATKQARCFLC